MSAVVQDGCLRLDSGAEQPYLIVGRDTAWKFTPGQDSPDADEPSAVRYEGALMQLVTRPSYDRFIGNDFAKPDGPIETTTFLGRPAWKLTLKQPPHKTHPLHWVVDAETGTLLRQANDGVDVVVEWTSFEIVDALPEETFTWSGPARTPDDRWASHEDAMARHQEMQAEYLRRLGIRDPAIVVTAKPSVLVHEMAEDGTFVASLSSPNGHLTRRPQASAEEDGVSHDASRYSWRQGEWRWSVSFFDDYLLTDEQLATLQAAFNASPDA